MPSKHSISMSTPREQVSCGIMGISSRGRSRTEALPNVLKASMEIFFGIESPRFDNATIVLFMWLMLVWAMIAVISGSNRKA